MVATPAGLLHDIGRQNPGVEVVLERHEPTWRTWRVPVILNVWGESVGDIVELVRRLEGAAGVAAIELDLASPNGGGRSAFPLGEDEAAAASLTAAVRRVWDGPLIVKLIAVPEIRAVARAVASAGADVIAAIGAIGGLAAAPDRHTTVPGGAFGGLSGPAIRPIALRAVHEIASAVRIPVIGIGGVSTLDDVLDLLAVGAVAVGVGVAALADPRLPVRLADELAAECRQRGLPGYALLVGTVRRR
jgi:dihydroorotate dehydrogenase (NAD+) catalytic subunit